MPPRQRLRSPENFPTEKNSVFRSDYYRVLQDDQSATDSNFGIENSPACMVCDLFRHFDPDACLKSRLPEGSVSFSPD